MVLQVHHVSTLLVLSCCECGTILVLNAGQFVAAGAHVCTSLLEPCGDCGNLNVTMGTVTMGIVTVEKRCCCALDSRTNSAYVQLSAHMHHGLDCAAVPRTGSRT